MKKFFFALIAAISVLLMPGSYATAANAVIACDHGVVIQPTASASVLSVDVASSDGMPGDFRTHRIRSPSAILASWDKRVFHYKPFGDSAKPDTSGNRDSKSGTPQAGVTAA